MRRNIKSLILVILILALGVASLAGCSNQSSDQASNQTSQTSNQEPAEVEDSFEKIKEKGQVIMGLDDTFAPMGFRDENNEIVGFDVDLAKEVFKRNNLELILQPIDWTMKEAELNSGNIDMIWNGYTITAERMEKVAFSKPYLKNRQIIITLADSDINSKADLEGKKVAAQAGSTAVDAMYTEPDIVAAFDGGEPILFDTNNEAFMDLEAGRSDAVVADEILARYYIKQRGPEKYKILDEDFGEEEYGIGFRKQDKKLLEMVDNTLDEMRKDGTFDSIYNKWFAD
ncbi:MAG TPA: amino acid ABC transporter substrate-binding protein [Thermoanaerobacterales bacterium]|uniref:amino acid ABC transporter substrate-binding protein n=1 Tax=Tepidanaerobacter sp. GT38 TaxID=2722793 RepID=UPI0018150882|nr:amino acid ABC transporter substrate-binding protein [Tepidanaerobacter sp. GT38]MCG1012545.1 amino acid ABC transporter substrate-binding protein [Tepidanaerobacter sp. GT38]HHY42839.1 amino acid ABC transporter substrate-binding protein [Thermoanaerobacterales bacterium]